MNFTKFFQSCAICQSFIPPIDWLCPYCWKKMESHYLYSKDVHRVEKEHPHFRLFDWREENNTFARYFLNSLKRAKAPFVFNRLALECFSRFVHSPAWPKKSVPVFVPAPSSLPEKPNHALEFAKSLSFYFGGEIQPLLKRTVFSSQKGKTRLDRSRIHFELTNKMSPYTAASTQHKTFIFTDDILTTGWTAKKAFQALGSPQNFLVCTLAWRQPPPLTKKDILNQAGYKRTVGKKILFFPTLFHCGS